MSCCCCVYKKDWKLLVTYRNGDVDDLMAHKGLELPSVFVHSAFRYTNPDGFQVSLDLNAVRSLRLYYTTG